jgi:aquaporin Z
MIKSNYIVEFLGTFFFLTVILRHGSFNDLGPLMIAVGLLGAIGMGGPISGGHFNPAVSTMMHLKNDAKVADMNDLVGYVVSQLLGGLTALRLSQML